MDLADVVRRHGPGYLKRFGGRLLPSHRAALEAILRCHTAACGGSLYACTDCGATHFAYHGCGHRACAQCGYTQAQAWLERQSERLLPVDYFLATFTVPEALRKHFRREQRFFYDLLFEQSAATLQEIAAQPRYLGGQLGLLGVLHTWTRQLAYHPHIHYLVPALALSPDGTLGWPKDPAFLLPVRRLSARFRSRMHQAIRERRPELCAQIATCLWRTPWVVHLQQGGRGEKVLEYLSRYIYKTAISSARLLWQNDQDVCFSYRESKSGETRTCTLGAAEFLRRFLQHVLPKGYRRVRTYGWLSPAAKQRHEHVRALLCAPLRIFTKPRAAAPPVPCRCCGRIMQRLRTIPRAPP